MDDLTEVIEPQVGEKLLKVDLGEIGDDLNDVFLNQKDVDLLINSVQRTRDKALIAVLWETGARASEIYGLSIGDIKDTELGKKIILNGYTGIRKLPVIRNVSFINDWLENHPLKDNVEAKVWVKEDAKGPGESISYNYIRKLVKNAAKTANLDKPVDLTHIRRSRTQLLSRALDEKEVQEWFGWVEKPDIESMQGCSDCSGCPFSCKVRYL